MAKRGRPKKTKSETENSITFIRNDPNLYTVEEIKPPEILLPPEIVLPTFSVGVIYNPVDQKLAEEKTTEYYSDTIQYILEPVKTTTMEARQKVLEQSTGTYLMFLALTDWPENFYPDPIMSYLLDNRPDCIGFDINIYNKLERKTTTVIYSLSNPLWTHIENGNHTYLLRFPSWNSFIRTDIIQSMPYLESERWYAESIKALLSSEYYIRELYKVEK